MTDQPWLSIVTVVKDDLTGISRTLQSLKGQQLTGVDYLVIDSSSQRDEVPKALDDAGIEFAYSWSEPQGIYSAMNTGLAQAQGTYIYFLNAGDELLPGVLQQVKNSTSLLTAPWLIGQIEVVSQQGSSVVTPAWNYQAEQRAMFARGRFAPHQGTFARTRDLLAAGGFNVKFRIAADYAAFLKLTTMTAPVMLSFSIARFYEGGTSTHHWKQSFSEFHQARMEILAPRGLAAFREHFYTTRQYLMVGLYRGIWSKIVKS